MFLHDPGDVIMLGKYMFRFNNPAEAARLREHRKVGGSRRDTHLRATINSCK